jgi:GT2 family glycosyltransferase
VLRHSRAPYELIFLDIGSLDGTAEYLAGIQAAASVRVEVVRTATDLGIGATVREALARAWGEFYVLLNNDTVVAEGWLDQLLALARLSPAVGLVGPMSNYAAPPQWVEEVPYRVGPRRGGRALAGGSNAEPLVDMEAVGRFAAEWRDKHKGKWAEADRLGGFCLLIKREVLAKLVPLDAENELGLFDTDLLGRRVRQAGYTLACCKDLFVHHFGSRTFAHGAPAPEPSVSPGR